MMKRTLLFALIALLVAAVTNAHAADKKPVSPWEIEKLDKTKAPDFTLNDVNGRTVSFASFRGKVVLLNFWATWCPACTAEMPAFNKAYEALKGRGLEVVAVSTDRRGDVREFLQKRPVSFTVLMDEARDITRLYKVFSLPTTFLIDRNGIIIEKFFGEYDWADKEMLQEIEKLF